MISVLSKVFKRLVLVRLGRFIERSTVLPNTDFPYRISLGTCDALLCVSQILQRCIGEWAGGYIGLCRLTSEQSVIRSTIREYTISSVAVVLSPFVRVTIAESLNRSLGNVRVV